jgi:hypothetical protein
VIVTPYVSAPAFVAHPTYLDVDDLRSGDPDQGDQTAALTNLLLMSSSWADGYCEQPLSGHLYTQNLRTRCSRDGTIRIHPDHTPAIEVLSFAYGYTPTALTTVANPTAWIEDGRNIVITLGASGGPWSGSLQFGTPVAGSQLYTQTTYTAGHVATVLAEPSAAAAESLTVLDPTSIVAGGTYRIWEPGVEESVTVAPTFTAPVVTAPPTATSIPLAAPALFSHNIGHDFSGMDHDLRLGIVNYTISQLMRPDTAAEDAYPDTKLDSGTRQQDPRQDGSGLVLEARGNLERFRRIR